VSGSPVATVELLERHSGRVERRAGPGDVSPPGPARLKLPPVRRPLRAVYGRPSD
jgi:hypothetical protein